MGLRQTKIKNDSHFYSRLDSNGNGFTGCVAQLAKRFFRHHHKFQQFVSGNPQSDNHIEFTPQVLHGCQTDAHFLRHHDIGELIPAVGGLLVVIDEELDFLDCIAFAVAAAVFAIAVLLQSEFVPEGTFGIGFSF